MTHPTPQARQHSSERARFGALEVVDLQALQREVVERYRNQAVLDANDAGMRLSVLEGDYRWHQHPDTDELFLVVAGELRIEFAGTPEVALREWQCLVVPAGVVHRTRAVGRTVNLTFGKQGARTVFVEAPPGH